MRNCNSLSRKIVHFQQSVISLFKSVLFYDEIHIKNTTICACHKINENPVY